MRELVAATYAAQEAERERIALDLHDSVAQELSAALMAVRRLPEDESGLGERAVAGLKSSIDALRRVSWEMRPPELERLGFQGAATRLLEEFEERSGMRVVMKDPSWEASGLDAGIASQHYRIIQECLANVQKHARGTRLLVAVRRCDGRLRVELEDDGVGFDPARLELSVPAHEHLGIAGMRERARLMGGNFEIASAPGKGTRIAVEVPCVD
jgi:signal transduction histidine kinase